MTQRALLILCRLLAIRRRHTTFLVHIEGLLLIGHGDLLDGRVIVVGTRNESEMDFLFATTILCGVVWCVCRIDVLLWSTYGGVVTSTSLAGDMADTSNAILSFPTSKAQGDGGSKEKKRSKWTTATVYYIANFYYPTPEALVGIQFLSACEPKKKNIEPRQQFNGTTF